MDSRLWYQMWKMEAHRNSVLGDYKGSTQKTQHNDNYWIAICEKDMWPNTLGFRVSALGEAEHKNATIVGKLRDARKAWSLLLRVSTVWSTSHKKWNETDFCKSWYCKQALNLALHDLGYLRVGKHKSVNDQEKNFEQSLRTQKETKCKQRVHLQTLK